MELSQVSNNSKEMNFVFPHQSWAHADGLQDKPSFMQDDSHLSPLRNFDSMFPASDKKEMEAKQLPETESKNSGYSDQEPQKDKMGAYEHSNNQNEKQNEKNGAVPQHKDQQVNIFDLHDPNKSKFPKIAEFLETTALNIFLLIITLWALFADDLRLLIFPKVMDIAFDVITILVILFFLVDIILNAIAVNGYLKSMFFILDLISTLTMILDITVLNEKIFYDNG